MSSYSDLVRVDSCLTEIIGVRILKRMEKGEKGEKESEEYHVIHILVGDNWKESARLLMPMYKNISRFAFHTLHRFLPWADVPEEQKEKSFWLHNPYFNMNSFS
jgi:hypothetical protein